MTFEELESAWGAQRSMEARPADLTELKKTLQPELRRRRRMLGYALAVNVFALVIFPLLAVANYRYDPVRYGTGWAWVYTACQLAVIVLWAAYSLRRFRRHRALLRQSADTVRAVTAVSLANVEAEMRDCTAWRRPIMWLTVVSVVAAIANGTSKYGWSHFGLQASMGTLALTLAVGAGFWRHYRVNLKPAQARLRELLGQME